MASDTQQKLVEVAARLFHEQGYAATGVATILREAGVNSGSLYHFFSGKQALLQAVLERYQRLLDPLVLAPVEAAEPDPIKRIFRLLEWYRGRMQEDGCLLGCPVGNLALEVSDTLPEVRPAVEANFNGWTEGIRRWLDLASDRLPCQTDRGALARFVLTVMEGGLMQARAAGCLEPFDDSVAMLRDYFDRLQAAGSGGEGEMT